MSSSVNRRSFMKRSIVASAGTVMALETTKGWPAGASGIKIEVGSKATIPQGRKGHGDWLGGGSRGCRVAEAEAELLGRI